jgi:outer membrane protein TolC
VLELKVLEGKAQLAEAGHALGTLEDSISGMKVEFNNLIGLPLDADLELVAQATETSDAAAGGLAAEALAHNPEVAATGQMLKKARAGLSAARAEYIPEVGAFAQYVYQNGVPPLSENDGVAGLRMNWMLAEFGKRSGQVHERRAQVAEAEENLQQVENRVRVDIEKDVRKLLRRAETGLEAARESVPREPRCGASPPIRSRQARPIPPRSRKPARSSPRPRPGSSRRRWSEAQPAQSWSGPWGRSSRQKSVHPKPLDRNQL